MTVEPFWVETDEPALRQGRSDCVMATSIAFHDELQNVLIPPLDSFAAFQEWTASEEFPERGRIDYVAGRIEVDMAPEELDAHGSVKIAVIYSLEGLVRTTRLGRLYSDRVRISSVEADLSVEPDVVFVSRRSLTTGRVRRVPKARSRPGRYIEIQGAPDLIMEIVSDSSVVKDTQDLPPAYWRAGVDEYWLADARGEQLQFQIHHRGPAGWERAPADPEGFQYSTVFERRFRLTRETEEDGEPLFDLEIRR